MPRISLLVAAGALALLFAAPPARAAYIVNIYQDGANVKADGEGALNLTGLRRSFGGEQTNLATFLYSLQGWILLAPGGPINYGSWLGVTGPSNLGNSGPINATNNTFPGIVGVAGSFGQLFVPEFYSGGPLPSGTATWNNQDFTTMGISPGSYTWTWGQEAEDQKFIINVGNQVPESSSVVLSACGLGFLSLVMWKRKHSLRLNQTH
jgi:hypothetical protein